MAPAQLRGELGERRGRAEADGEERITAGQLSRLHLNEVLLTGQSVAMADEHEQRRPAESAEVDGRVAGGVVQHDSLQADGLVHGGRVP